MREDIAKLWVADLRSGKYKQGQGYLHKNDKFCCIGVLCERAIKEGLEVNKRSSDQSYTYYDDENMFVPKSIQNWAGIKDHFPLVPSINVKLIVLNDEGKSFAEIADIIEKHYEEL